jgi:hypothetical protein
MAPNVQKRPNDFGCRENSPGDYGLEFSATISRISHPVQTRPAVIRRELRSFPETHQEIVQ